MPIKMTLQCRCDLLTFGMDRKTRYAGGGIDIDEDAQAETEGCADKRVCRPFCRYRNETYLRFICQQKCLRRNLVKTLSNGSLTRENSIPAKTVILKTKLHKADPHLL